MFPTAKHATALFGSSDRGALINKLSYEIPRIAAPILWPSSLGFKAATGERLNVGVLPNPMTFGASDSLNLMAYGAALFPDPGDWPFDARITGAWFSDAEPHYTLSAEIEEFLVKGPAIYIGFGSMKWHSKQSASAVFDAIAQWGGRALITAEWGGLQPPEDMPENIMFTGPVHHSLLFPRDCARASRRRRNDGGRDFATRDRPSFFRNSWISMISPVASRLCAQDRRRCL